MRADAEQHVFVNRDGQRIGALEHHADRLAKRAQRDVGVVDIFAQHADFASRLDVAVPLVDPVEASQERCFAAARRTDQGCDDARLDRDFHVFEGLKVAVPEV